MHRVLCGAALAVKGVADLRRALPQAKVLFDSPDLAVSVTAVGERPVVLRLPSKPGQLPPAEWETARLDASKVLVAITFWRCTGERPPVAWR